ncbi:ABC transporter ATP-binding protein [Oceanobacillus sp. CFH 90083]|uniref:ABC transporter ATP-binding protein n=1 Tax=Oceanobacillus sp. CFH 90083 TaxID=2592336 RepID=UPI00128D1E19|nr:dipeptide ABC transporter ATP-binding protein [Oceanobacillus sp. CFH 90083]
MSQPLLEIKNVKKHYQVKSKNIFSTQKNNVHAVNDVSLTINEGETYGLVGESGCGKSTLARVITGLIKPDSGRVFIDGEDFLQLKGKSLRDKRRTVQMVFQKPYESLNPKMTIGEIIRAPFDIHNVYHKREREEKVKELLDLVGLSEKYMSRYPHEFSGGQRQRIGIARAIALHPKLIICDEAVSALDVSIQAQVLNLLDELQKEFKLTYLFISHDLSVVRHVSDNIGIMYLGEIVETGDADTIYSSPKHPYTEALLSAIPKAHPKQVKTQKILEGDLPSPINPPEGCKLNTRCPHVMSICKTKPNLESIKEKQKVACYLYNDQR